MKKFDQYKKEVLQGVGVVGLHLKEMMYIVRTESDLELFLDKYMNGNVANATHEFKMYKRAVNRVTQEQFEEEFKTNKKSALEGLLQEPIQQADLDLLQEKSVAASDIWTMLQTCKDHTINSLLKNTEILNKKELEDAHLFA